MSTKSDVWGKSNGTLPRSRIMEGLPKGIRRRKLSYSEKGKEMEGECNFRDCTIDLSDNLLLLILSFLSMKDAARTSVLSRRWRNLWVSRSSIRFDVDEILGFCARSRCAGNILHKYEPSTSEEFDEFVRLVNRYFDLKLGTDIKEFRLHVRARSHYKYVDEWLTMAKQMNVEKLELDFRGSDGNNPFHLVVGRHVSSLKHFSAVQCVMSISPCFDGFNSLASLALDNVVVPDDFISFCPSLEKLCLIDCHGLNSFIVAPSPKNLKHVTVINSANFIDVSADNLVSFECSGCYETYLYPFVNVNDDSGSPKSMGFPDRKNSPAKCIFTPNPDLVGFKCLKVLILLDVNLGPLHLRQLLQNCPAVEELAFEDCYIVPSPLCILKISGLLHLQSLKLVNCTGVERVIVCATNLKSFVFYAASRFHLFSRGSCTLLDNDGKKFSRAVGKASLLKHLHLKCSSIMSDISNFSALETVTLEDMDLSDKLIGVLLFNCLLLKVLTLIECYGIFTLNVVGPFLRLKYLTVGYCKQLKEIRISAANLVKFKYYGPLVCFSVRDVPQLVSAEIKVEANDYDISTTHVLSMLSEDVPNLQALVYHIEDQSVPDALPAFLNLKELVLVFGHQSHMLSWVTVFLLASPFLEKLRVQLPRSSSAVTQSTTLSKEWTHYHLKKVELFLFSGIKKEIKFATSVLQNAKSLQLMKIDPRPVDNPSRPSLDWVQTGRDKTFRLLKMKATPGVQLVVI